MKAVVAHELNRLCVEEVQLDPPKAGEVKIKMAAAGVCHSDLSALNGTIPQTFPVVLGHEGAGVVEEVGEGVTHVQAGDHVVTSFVPNCGTCPACLRHQGFLCHKMPRGGTMLDGTNRLHMGDTELSAFTALGNMAEFIVCPAISVVPIDKDIPLRVAALVGCGVTTGVGAAINTARVEPGSSVAVFGCGGVGLSVIQGARIAGASRIFAVDLSEDKIEMARKFGATDGVPAGEGAVKTILKATRGGVDYAFEAIGIASVFEEAIAATRSGGTATLVGVGNLKSSASINMLLFPLTGKTLCGCMYGSANVRVDFPRFLNLYKQGQLDLEGMVTKTYGIDQAPEAFEDLKNGVNARGVIAFD